MGSFFLFFRGVRDGGYLVVLGVYFRFRVSFVGCFFFAVGRFVLCVYVFFCFLG